MNYRVDRQIDKLKGDIVDLFDLDDWENSKWIGKLTHLVWPFW